MTEKSYFFNGTSRGDAEYAPYSSALFAGILKTTFSTEGAYVLPDQLNNLEVTAAAGRTVSINTGRALVYGYWYENDAAYSLTLGTNTSAYPRFDRIVVEIDTENETSSIKAIRGVPSATPAIPALPECGTLVYMPLARIYLPSAYAATASYYVFDERIFANNAYHINTYNVQNRFPNGSFLVFGDSENSGVNRNPMPGGWIRIGAGSALKSLDRFDEMGAGRVVNSYSAASDGDGWAYTILTAENFTGMFTLRLLVKVTVGECAIDFAGVSLQVPVAEGVQEIIIRVSTTGYSDLQLTHQTAAAVFSFSDIRFTHGFVIPSQATFGNYIVMFDTPVQAKRTGAPSLIGLGTGTTDLVYAEDFGSDVDNVGVIVSGVNAFEVKALIVLLRINDSGSAAGNAYATLQPITIPDFVRVDLDGVVNDSSRWRLGLISIDNEIVNSPGMIGYFPARNRLSVTATGGHTLDAYLAVVGAIL